MTATKTGFTPLEQAVIRMICEFYPDDRVLLEAQLATATTLSRKNTGGGFFTYFEVEQTSLAALGGRTLRDGPYAKIDGLMHGMGFILWLKDGYTNCLEGYSFADSTIGINLEEAGFELFEFPPPSDP